MTRGRAATVIKFGTAALFLSALLLVDVTWGSSPGLISSALKEIAFVFWDSETQWVVFLCLGIYFATFLFLRSPKGGAHGVTRPTFWLACALFIGAVVYAIGYSPSTQALTLLGGAVLGQGAAFLKSRKRKAILKSESRKAESGNGFATFVVVVFVVLIAMASVWHIDLGHTFGVSQSYALVRAVG